VRVFDRSMLLSGDSPSSWDAISESMYTIRMRHTISEMAMVNVLSGVSVFVVLDNGLILLWIIDPQIVDGTLLRGSGELREEG